MSSNRSKGGKSANLEKLGEALRYACSTEVSLISGDFLCRSVGTLNPPEALVVREDASIDSATRVLKQRGVGCVLITDRSGKLTGIFSERDFMTKVYGEKIDISAVPITAVMTPNPLTVTPESTIAYALNLMSDGGFRHVPMVDQAGEPVGIISVRDVIDKIVEGVIGTLDKIGVGG